MKGPRLDDDFLSPQSSSKGPGSVRGSAGGCLLLLCLVIGLVGGLTVFLGTVVYVPEPVWIAGLILLGVGAVLAFWTGIRISRENGAGVGSSLWKGTKTFFKFLWEFLV